VAQYGITRETGLVAGFAPFALLGPTLGCRTSVPDMDVTRPRTLTAAALAKAVSAIDADMMFLSPAALTNVLATADDPGPFDGVRLLLTVGAPVGAPLLDRAQELLRNASLRTPYGMTECLLVADVTREAVHEAGEGNGVCVGPPTARAQVRIAPLDGSGAPGPDTTTDAGVTGEIQVHAPHMLAGYDRLWRTDRAARTGTPQEPWHRTGDVGHLDEQGRLWVEGRLPHVIVTAEGVVTPVGVELAAERAGVSRAAAVGVGPRGTQQLVVVAEGLEPGLAPAELAAAVRASVAQPIAAVLGVRDLPTDIRHNAKIDRARMARWATAVLAGERIRRP
jgi:acyl-CoA synthetase (AMP-forming)/AMP-acid ligase II